MVQSLVVVRGQAPVKQIRGGCTEWGLSDYGPQLFAATRGILISTPKTSLLRLKTDLVAAPLAPR